MEEENKKLEMIIIKSEDIVRAIGNIDYSFSGELRAFFTKTHTKELKINPVSRVGLYYRLYKEA